MQLMVRWLRGLWTGLRLEAKIWLRTREVHLYLLVPSLLLAPLTAVVGTSILSLGSLPLVAVPDTLPSGFELAAYLEDEGFEVLAVPDPFAAWQQGDVQAAVTTVRVGAGIASARTDTEPWTDRGRYEIEAIAADVASENRVKSAVRHAGDDALLGWVALAGGDRDSAWLAGVRRVPLGERAMSEDDAHRIDAIHHWMVLYVIGLASMLGAVVLPAQCVGDRVSGALEAMATTLSPMSALLTARIVVFTGLQATAITCLLVSMWLLVPDAPAPGPWLVLDALDVFAVLCVTNALLLFPGLASVDLKGAMNWGPMAVMPIAMVLGLGALKVETAGLPMLSAGVQGPLALRLIGVMGTFAVAGLLVVLCARVFRGDRLLPPSGAGT